MANTHTLPDGRTLDSFYVNPARWDGPPDLPPEWSIVNAPRPLNGARTWMGEGRYGTFYAAGPMEEYGPGYWGWAANGATQVEFIDNAEIERRVLS